ncbi:hypothetical protein BCU68_07525 [Vibrio sp. 10N.286.49.B3]|uniref:DoxX family protein n=1 Tax=Vibrio sp. 10N.286.49.B3 TaxID=1880855 RepID=UPI000C865A83|nr:DoxX family protein [Vibrio sp. 10N.286.49.B3]PMH38674.1 hypothetical protein BCU68_07525 [Vibrio sp. 10N.286.49.B3]
MSELTSQWIQRYDGWVNQSQRIIVPLFLLFLRLWVAWVFFNAGLTKIASWDSTLYLFEFEYQVPILPWQLAAYIGTAAELILPAFLVLGIFTRPMTAMLFVFNITAVVSYPLLWERGYYDHQLWGLMMLIIILWGAGSLSVDKLIKARLS